MENLTPGTIGELLQAARARLDRLEPEAARREAERGALLIETRSADARRDLGVIPGSVHVPLSVLFWRLDVIMVLVGLVVVRSISAAGAEPCEPPTSDPMRESPRLVGRQSARLSRQPPSGFIELFTAEFAPREPVTQDLLGR